MPPSKLIVKNVVPPQGCVFIVGGVIIKGGDYIYIYIYTRTHTHTHTHAYIHTYIHTYIHIYIYIYIYIDTHIYTCVYIYIYIHTYIHIHVYIIHINVWLLCGKSQGRERFPCGKQYGRSLNGNFQRQCRIPESSSCTLTSACPLKAQGSQHLWEIPYGHENSTLIIKIPLESNPPNSTLTLTSGHFSRLNF